MKLRYLCEIDGNGNNPKQGIFGKTKTGITFEFTDQYTSYGSWYKKGDILKCKFDNKCKHCLRDWEDGTYTIYPNRGGVPYYIYPGEIKEDLI